MYNIILAIEASLQPIAAINKSPFITDVVNFPSITILRSETKRQHAGAASQLKTLSTKIRGYVWGENSVVLAETLARNVEFELQSIDLELVDSIKVLSVMTDAGILAPHGMCELEIEVQWYEI